MNMKKNYFYFLFLALCACSTTNYTLTTDLSNQELSESVVGETSQINTPYSYHSSYTVDGSLQPLFIPENELRKCGFQDLEQFLDLANRGKYKKAKAVLASQKLSDPYMEIYLEGLLLFLQQKHKESIAVVKSIQSSKLELQRELLLLDNEYEMNKKKGKSFFIEKYQQIIDTYQPEKEYSDLIKSRIKYLRYS